MTDAMPRKKRHFPALEPPNDIWVRRLAEWRREAYFLMRLKARHGIQAAAADNPDFRFLVQSLTGSF